MDGYVKLLWRKYIYRKLVNSCFWFLIFCSSCVRPGLVSFLAHFFTVDKTIQQNVDCGGIIVFKCCHFWHQISNMVEYNYFLLYVFAKYAKWRKIHFHTYENKKPLLLFRLMRPYAESTNPWNHRLEHGNSCKILAWSSKSQHYNWKMDGWM